VDRLVMMKRREEEKCVCVCMERRNSHTAI
jgi:hypothetical protein